MLIQKLANMDSLQQYMMPACSTSGPIGALHSDSLPVCGASILQNAFLCISQGAFHEPAHCVVAHTAAAVSLIGTCYSLNSCSGRLLVLLQHLRPRSCAVLAKGLL